MRGRGVIAGVLAVCGAVVLSGPARADQYDFVMQLDNMGVSYESIIDMIDIGKAVCHDLRSGSTPRCSAGCRRRDSRRRSRRSSWCRRSTTCAWTPSRRWSAGRATTAIPARCKGFGRDVSAICTGSCAHRPGSVMMAGRRSNSSGGGAVLFGVLILIAVVIKYYWWFIAAAAVVGLFFAVRALARYVRERKAIAAREAEELAYRADRPDRWARRGDSRGVYGVDGAELMRSISPELLRCRPTRPESHPRSRRSCTRQRNWPGCSRRRRLAGAGRRSSVLVQRQAAVRPRLRDCELGYALPSGERARSGAEVARL